MGVRKKPCEFCEDCSINVQEGKNGHQLSLEWYPDNNGIFAISSFANDETGESYELSADLNFKFCPMCGRKLL